MNRLERFVYDFVKSSPKLKQTIRNTYQFAFDLLPSKKEFAINPISLKEGCFLGFHDIQAFSEKNDLLLALKNSFDLRMPKSGESVQVGYIKLDEGVLGDFIKLDDSFAWNFHKGCRLQWLDDKRIIYNTADKQGKLIASIVELNNGLTESLDYPIDTVSRNGKLATSFSYQRLEEYMPGYGYPYRDTDAYIGELAPNETGLFIIDLESNKRELLISLKELAELSAQDENSGCSHHYVTHTSFSYDSRYISFLHRWVGAEKQKRYTRLMIFDLKTKKVIKAPITNNMASHYVWNKENEIVAYCNFENKDCHALLKIDDLQGSYPIAYPKLNSDGHQSFINSNSFVTDTYPDKWRMAKLYRVDIDTNEVKLIASVHSPKKFQTKQFTKHIACDLHPRVSSDGKYVCFDTVKSGVRSLAVMQL